MSKGLKYTFLAHAIVSTIMGLGLALIPKTFSDWVNWSPVDPSMSRICGAFVLGIAVSSWLGFVAKEWEEVRIVVRMENGVTLFGLLVGLYAVLFDKGPSFLWVTVGIMAVFGILFVYYGNVFKTATVPAAQES